MLRLDAVIFGATGFTGKHTVIHMVDIAKKYGIRTWGVAGRSQKKLEDLMKEVAKKTGEDMSGVKIIIADVGDESSIQEMCAQCKVIINCCGPYRLYGEPVVKAAIDNQTHYVDVSGEPQFMELMQLRYHDLARQVGVFVVSACGWDSIPCDMGVMYLQENFGGTLNSVESYLSMHVAPDAVADARGSVVINYGTWESLLYSLHHSNELLHLRKQLYPSRLPNYFPKLMRHTFHKRDDKFFIPFQSSDESVVYRTQRYLYEEEHERPIQFKAYVTIGNVFYTFFFILGSLLLITLSKFTSTMNLMLKYPNIFSFGKVSREGPTEAVMNNSFFTFDLVGEGWDQGTDTENPPNKRVVAKVSGVNPGYGATCTALLMCAVTLLNEREKMPPRAGVLTSGAAFRNTSLVKNLTENNLKYEIVEVKKI